MTCCQGSITFLQISFIELPGWHRASWVFNPSAALESAQEMASWFSHSSAYQDFSTAICKNAYDKAFSYICSQPKHTDCTFA